VWSPKGTTLRVVRCPTLQVSQFLFLGQRSDTFLTDHIYCGRNSNVQYLYHTAVGGRNISDIVALLLPNPVTRKMCHRSILHYSMASGAVEIILSNNDTTVLCHSSILALQ